MSNIYVSLEEKIGDILLPAFGAVVILTLMEGKCTDGVIKIRDDAIGEIKNLFLSQIKTIDEMIEEKGSNTVKVILQELKQRLLSNNK